MSGKRVFAMGAVLLCASLPVLASAESEESAGIVTTVNGNATLTRAMALAQPVSLRMRDEILVRDRIQTQAHSLVRVLLGGKALITIRELSVLTVTEEANRVTVDLQSGKVGVAVVKGRMRPGEVIEIRSPNATAAVRGTVFVVEVDPIPAGQSGAAAPTTTRVHLFQGALDVSARLDPAQPAVRLAEMQSVVVAGNTVGSVRKLARDQVAALTADLKPQQVQTADAPSEFTGSLVAREQDRAVMIAATLLAPAPNGTVNGVVGTVTNVTGTTADVLEQLMGTLGREVVGSAVNGVGTTISGLGATVSGLGGTLGGTVGGLGGTVGGIGGTVGGTVGGIGGTAGGTVSGTVGGIGGTVGGTVGGVVGGLLGGGALR
jgi:hypothetical protein